MIKPSKAQKARDIVAKFPHLSKKELGKLLYKENPILFKDAEHAREFIRGVTGGNKSHLNHFVQSDKYIGNLPEGEKNDFSPFVIKGKRIGILSDIHIPYHDLKALGCAINHLVKTGIDTLVLNGDIIDCYQLSRWQPDPNKRKHFEEIEMLLTFLDDMIDVFKCQIVFKLGNHEERYEKFLYQKTPELVGMHVLSWKHLLNLRFAKCKFCSGMGEISGEECTACEGGVVANNVNRGIHLVKDKRIIKIGKLAVVHGHEFTAGFIAPVNPARGLFLRAKTNTLGGHFHRTSEHIEKDLGDKIIGAWSVGSLCELHPFFMPVNNWNHGFAFVESDGEEFEVHNYKIINGKVR